MNEKIHHILDQISELEEELRTIVREQESRFLYQIEGRRIEFEHSIEEAHRQLKVGVLRWFLTVRPQNYLTAPIIYGMIVPLVLLDMGVSLYQATCFPIYRIRKVRRSDYIVFDHQHLAYLNIIEKFHCLYCSYANGLIAYAREIVARTEQYFCPIKHAHRILGTHPRYPQFLAYGDADDFQARLEEYRVALSKEVQATKRKWTGQ